MEKLFSVFFPKDLGARVDLQLRFYQHIWATVSKAGGIATNLLKTGVSLSHQFMTTLFVSDVRQILDFSSPFWNTGFTGDLQLLEAVQCRWAKQLISIPQFFYRARLFGRSLYSIRGRLLRTDVILCYKIFRMSSITPSDIHHVYTPWH